MGQREVWALRTNGEEFPIEASISKITVADHKLFTVIHRDITSRTQMLASLRSAHTDLQELVGAMDSVQEDERRRISREIHDDLQQTLAAIKMNVTAIVEARPQRPQGGEDLLSEIAALADTAMDSTRRIIRDLRPMLLEELGIVAALEALAKQTNQRHGIECSVDLVPTVDLVLQHQPSVATCLFRAAQEALNNVVRHAKASKVDISLNQSAGGQLVLRVRDNGIGLINTEARKPGSFGLLGMRERVRALDGAINIHGAPGSGTTVEVIVPIPSAAAMKPANPTDHPATS
jgi:signal transduction histidine kinase